ncbi:MAG TPA: type II toxin-antitoxin system HicA family toxin [Ktedonobacteraceae bacterium]|nr:type II toxin-antitoxin system HicA family toxin [Ktedonobacteraceae bacterium]
MKVRDVLKRLNEEGWYLARRKGSHRQFKHQDKPGRVTVAGHPREDIPADTLQSIYEQAGWEKDA